MNVNRMTQSDNLQATSHYLFLTLETNKQYVMGMTQMRVTILCPQTDTIKSLSYKEADAIKSLYGTCKLIQSKFSRMFHVSPRVVQSTVILSQHFTVPHIHQIFT
jgi:DNA-binding transcriptional regulator YiaG